MNTANLTTAFGILLMVSILFPGCQGKRETSNQAIDQAHNSRNSVDWSGTYQGTLPCADCPGIHYKISLHEDGTYQLSTQYLEKSDSVYTESGQFTWNDAGSQITLEERGEKFQVGENRLFHLDMEGNRITGDLAEHYILEKAAGRITGRYWKLIEVNGKAVEPGSTQKEPYIQLNEEDERLEATGGCNGLGGTFELKEPNRIKFSQIIGTMMACDNMEVETGLINALQTADSYHLNGDSLQLFRARMAPLAKFVAGKK